MHRRAPELDAACHPAEYSELQALLAEKSYLFTENGRRVFDDGISRLWWCPDCHRWRPWSRDRCPRCGAARDAG